MEGQGLLHRTVEKGADPRDGQVLGNRGPEVQRMQGNVTPQTPDVRVGEPMWNETVIFVANVSDEGEDRSVGFRQADEIPGQQVRGELLI